MSIDKGKAFQTLAIICILSLFLPSFCSLVKVASSENSTPVSGVMNENTVWTAQNSPYVITSDLTVNQNATLTIEAGAVIKFAGNYSLLVKGTLNATGSPSAPIIFTSNASSPSTGDWKGIKSYDINSFMIFDNARIEYATNGIYNNNSKVLIADSEIVLNDIGVYFFQDTTSNTTQDSISNNEVRANNIGVQIDVYYSAAGDLRLENNAVTSNNEGIEINYFSKGSFNISIAQNVISLNNASGISIDSSGEPIPSFVNVTQNYITFNKHQGISLNLWNKAAASIFSIEDNDIHNNTMYDLKFEGQYTNVDVFNASQNYWSTVSTELIDAKIYDFYDDHKLGKVNYVPVLEFPLQVRYVGLAIDRSEPIITVSSPLNNTFTRLSNVSMLWNGFDAGSGISYYTVQLDSHVYTDAGFNYTFVNLTEGTHVIFILASDKAGNTGETQVLFVVDLTAPVISDISVVNGTVLKSATLNLTWSGSDALSGIDHYEIRLDGNQWINLANRTNYNLTHLPDGLHVITVKAFDNAQNTEEAAISLSVNTSLLLGPGWIDDIAVFGGISLVIIIGVFYFFVIRRRINTQVKPSPPPSV